MKKIFVVDDEVTICTTIKGILTDEGYEVVTATSGERALKRVSQEMPDLMLLDIWLPGISGLEVLKKIKVDHPDLPVVIMSGHGTIETAVKATKWGAYEFIEKPISLDKLIISVQNALAHHSLQEENKALKKKIKQKGGHQLIGDSEFMKQLKEQLKLAAPTNSSILITGENGTGKEVVANTIHENSSRCDQPFVAVNCAAIPEGLIESELFGHEKGAFTGATHQKKGKFDAANGGTLLLDEIGDMSLITQAKILRILQEKSFERVGGSTVIEVDVRMIAATNKNLEEEIKKGNFREDLYYRLNVIPFHLSPLRERQGDIQELVNHFLKAFSKDLGIPQKKISKGAMEILLQYGWPGNVRELKNFVERIIIMSRGKTVEVKDIPLNIREGSFSVGAIAEENITMKEAKIQFEKRFILEKLDQNEWNITKTSEVIGVERSNLHRKMKQYGIDTKSAKG